MEKTKILLLDVETANDTRDSLVYDIGFIVADYHNNIYEKKSFIVSDIFIDEYNPLMTTSYYNKKIPQYIKGIAEGERKVITFYELRQIILSVMEKYGIKTVGAYNTNFDRNALNTTLRFLTNSKYRWFFPYETEFIDIWNMACQVICSQKKYIKWCLENGFYSNSGNVKTSAEIVYRFLQNELDFEESHTGLEDVLIEYFIFLTCKNKKIKMDCNINRLCWRIPTQKHKDYIKNFLKNI